MVRTREHALDAVRLKTPFHSTAASTVSYSDDSAPPKSPGSSLITLCLALWAAVTLPVGVHDP